MKLKPIAIALMAFIGLSTGAAYADQNDMIMDKTVAAVGVINSIDLENHKVNITHEPIKAVGWPAMKMDFKIAESVELKHIKNGAAVDFKMAKGKDGMYMIVDLHHRHEAEVKLKMNHKEVDHKGMKHD